MVTENEVNMDELEWKLCHRELLWRLLVVRAFYDWWNLPRPALLTRRMLPVTEIFPQYDFTSPCFPFAFRLDSCGCKPREILFYFSFFVCHNQKLQAKASPLVLERKSIVGCTNCEKSYFIVMRFFMDERTCFCLLCALCTSSQLCFIREVGSSFKAERKILKNISLINDIELTWRPVDLNGFFKPEHFYFSCRWTWNWKQDEICSNGFKFQKFGSEAIKKICECLHLNTLEREVLNEFFNICIL